MAAAGVIADFELPARSRGRRAAGSARPQTRRRAAARVGRRDGFDRACALRRSAPLALGRRSARRQHERHLERGALGHDRSRRHLRASPVHAAARRLLDRRSAAARRAGVAAVPTRPVAGTTFRLPAGGQATLLAPYPFVDSLDHASRLWIAALRASLCVSSAISTRYGFPIRYRYVKQSWPSAMYQTVFATEPGSAEMPSAGRPFTPELVTRLVSRGVQIAPLVLHTGVASLEKPRAAVRGVLPRAARDRRARQRRQARRTSRHRRRNDRRSRAGDRDRRTRHDVSGRRMDQPRDHAGSAAAIGDRTDHRPSRAARHASALLERDCRSGHRHRRLRPVTCSAPMPKRDASDTSGTNSAIHI